MRENKIQSGQLLIAEPFMADPHFKRAVILLCEHAEGGSLGFILNKSLDMKVDELIADFPDFDSMVYFGGPVQTDTIHYIHNIGEMLEDSQKIAHGVYWGGDFEKLKFLISSKMVEPKNIRFFVGYAGWSEGQLLEEMSYGSWMMDKMDANYLFRNQAQHLWQDVLENKGNTYSVIAQMPDGWSWN